MPDNARMRCPDPAFWRDKKVLITGHTGFKGSWLTIWLNRLGANITGIALQPSTSPALFNLADISSLAQSYYCDIRDSAMLASHIRSNAPEIVFHLAAQPLVRASYRDPLGTFATNIMGTANVLDALRGIKTVRSVVAITTDKVYQNLEWPYPYREDDALGGHDPYSASKAATEIIVASYRDAFLSEQNTNVATARAGNVIGGGDWSEDRLIPDAIRAWESGATLEIRCPDAIRPWQHVLEPLAGYMMLAEKLFEDTGYVGAYNFGPETSEAATVRTVVESAHQVFGKGDIKWGNADGEPHEAGWLALEIAKARTRLGITQRWALNQTIARTMRWYVELAAGVDARLLCNKDIQDYEEAA